jgi:uncharacterized protein YndB with AHSA1/START domain
MEHPQLTQVPVMKTGMLIRKPVAEVFEAFVNPDITTQIWFTKSRSPAWWADPGGLCADRLL